ncbi:MAG: hypothetical protein QGG42_12350 [Phycisphaerae bacterium]|jgi:hypothetical protein|nr:hypothetical protein [Phycisphaerae bacterium]
MTDRKFRTILIAVVLSSVCRSGSAAKAPQTNSPASLKAAVGHLISTFGDRYPQGRQFLSEIDRLKPGDKEALAELQRKALIANPLVSGRPILFVTRSQYINEHGTEATMYQTGEINTRCFRGGGALKLLDAATEKVTTILAAPKGVIRDPEVHFDGKKVVFAMRRDVDDDYHVYEINTDGDNLKQLTFAPRVSDIQPVYMPDGKIIFSSTRDPKYIPCQRHLMANLFSMNGDGSNIRQIGYNTQFEGRASLMPDGRILYTRWEYVDKHYASAYGLWTANPDGTNHALYWGGYGWQPGPVVDARVVPGTRRFLAVFSAVHELAWGAMVIGDRSRGLDGMEPIVRSWPADIRPHMSHWNREERVGGRFDSFRGIRVKYEDPYPLSKEFILCSRQLAHRKPMGLFLVDTFGNELPLHSEAPGCFDPMPIASRTRPPVIPTRVDLSKTAGTFHVQNVYIGESMDRVKVGAVKFIRVVEAPSKRTFPPRGIGDWTPARSGDSHHPVATNWHHYNNKRILGRAPVEADGSAYFSVPAGKFVYFQLLDADGMMIHSMRSGAMLQPGESASCVGCHEDHLKPVSSPAAKRSTALKRAPSPLAPWYGPARKFSYAREVQPVLDKHCIRCHDYDAKDDTDGKAAAINLSGDKGPAFNLSYTNLMARSPAIWVRPKPDDAKPLISSVGAGPTKVIGPYTWGSHRSALVDMLRAGHKPAGAAGKPRVKLSAEDLDRIITWVDLNVPYYPSHVTYYRTNTFGRCPLDHKEMVALGRLAAAAPGKVKYGWNNANSYSVPQLNRLIMNHGSPINFTRPARSLCLTGFTDRTNPKYVQALALIGKGAQRLRDHPRSDMPNFTPCPADQARLDYLAKRQAVEQRNRQAIIAGTKVYDK